MDKEKLISFLNGVEVDSTGEIGETKYILQLKDSDEWARYYTILNSNEELERSEDASMAEEHASVLTYKSNDYKIRLNANFDENYYTLSVEELEKYK